VTIARPVQGDRYVLGPVIGKGGSAEVYRAWDQGAERPVAVKLFHGDLAPSAGVRQGPEFARLAELRHGALVQVLDWGVRDERPFLVMDLFEGETLAQRLGGGALPPADGVAVAARLAAALQVMHRSGVVHRDVKPGNVLLDGAGAAYLTDLGIARVLGTAHATRTGEILGTAAYMAPEQVRGGAVGPPADVYALGLILLECLVGYREFDGGVVESAVARLHRSPRIPTTLSGGLRHLLAAMTAMEPAARPDAATTGARLGQVAAAELSVTAGSAA
jgi:eukaryotic-like serine/threonine-protein kinase